jgi:hypothetical protein
MEVNAPSFANHSPPNGFAKVFVLFAPWLLFAQTSAAVGMAFFSHRSWMSFEYDDFFYYLKVAENLAAGNGSTYNGIVATNGYHPLWLIILTAACFVLHSGRAIFAFVCCAIVLSTVVTYLISRRVMIFAGVDSVYASALSLYVAVYACREYFSGMESIVVVPLSLLLIGHLQRGDALSNRLRAFLTGLLTSFVILARLDAAILVALLFLAVLLNPGYRRQLSFQRAASAFLGLTPLAVYFWINLHFFGALMPVSGAAKQLRDHSHPSIVVLHTIFHTNAKTEINFTFVLLSCIAAMVSLPRLRDPRSGFLLPPMLFPIIYYSALSFLSDWYLSDWYFYTIRIALCTAFAFWFTRQRLLSLIGGAGARFALIGVAVFVVSTNWWPVPDANVLEAAIDLHAFEATHPGIYAMGDRAGKVGYLLENPLIQLEGLVMDRSFLEHMKRSEDLHSVLPDYNVRYYIGSSHKPFQGCFYAIESYQAGPSSPRLHGEFCEPPVARFQHGDVETLVYDMAHEPYGNGTR